MAFVDDLALELYSISLVGFLALYITIRMYLANRRGEKSLDGYLKAGAVPMLILGAFILIMGLFGEFSWPLPGSYNILFYDPYVMLGIILVAGSASVLLKQKLQSVGFLSLLAGLVVAWYGVHGYLIGLTSSPIGLLGLFLAFGSAAVFAYPMTLMIDNVALLNGKQSKVWMACLILFCISVFAASAVAALIATLAIPVHLASAP